MSQNNLKTQRTLVPDYIRNLVVYQAGKPIEELARERGLSHISKLASNENPLGPSPLAIKEMTEALWSIHRYPDMHAHQLKSDLCKLYKLKRENIILGNGSEGIMSYIVRAFLQPGEEVLTSESTFIGFYILAKSVGANLIKVPMTPDFKYDVEKLAAKISSDTKIIYLANPNNPTGTYITKKEFDYLMSYVPPHILVILDEAYFEYTSDCDDFPDSMNYRYDNVITLRTFSKAYGLAGIRVGYGFAHEDLISNLTKIKLPFEPNLIAQKGAIGALKDKNHLDQTQSLNKRMMQECRSFLLNKGFNPISSITNFITLDTGSKKNADELFNSLLDLGVIIRPLSSNEMPSFVRISMGTELEMQHFYEGMETVQKKWNKDQQS
jgi:histidinol-phosphate aminotransferase